MCYVWCAHEWSKATVEFMTALAYHVTCYMYCLGEEGIQHRRWEKTAQQSSNCLNSPDLVLRSQSPLGHLGDYVLSTSLMDLDVRKYTIEDERRQHSHHPSTHPTIHPPIHHPSVVHHMSKQDLSLLLNILQQKVPKYMLWSMVICSPSMPWCS